MKLSILDILICPLCHGSLTLHSRSLKEDVVVEGELRCSVCGKTYLQHLPVVLSAQVQAVV